MSHSKGTIVFHPTGGQNTQSHLYQPKTSLYIVQQKRRQQVRRILNGHSEVIHQVQRSTKNPLVVCHWGSAALGYRDSNTSPGAYSPSSQANMYGTLQTRHTALLGLARDVQQKYNKKPVLTLAQNTSTPTRHFIDTNESQQRVSRWSKARVKTGNHIRPRAFMARGWFHVTTHTAGTPSMQSGSMCDHPQTQPQSEKVTAQGQRVTMRHASIDGPSSPLAEVALCGKSICMTTKPKGLFTNSVIKESLTQTIDVLPLSNPLI